MSFEKFRCRNCLTVFEELYTSEVLPCPECGSDSDSYANASGEEWSEIHTLSSEITKMRRDLSRKESEIEELINSLNEEWGLDLTLKDIVDYWG